MTLPAVVAQYLDKVRGTYIGHYTDIINDTLAETKGGEVGIEAAFAREGEEANQRLDLFVDNGDHIERTLVIVESSCPWQHSEHDLGDGKRLLVDELVWFAFTLIAQPATPDLAFVHAWYRRWFDQGAEVEKPFGGHVHFLDIEEGADGYRIDLDLGSAPVEAVDELATACLTNGARSLWMFSGADALAARVPDELADEMGDLDESGMLELPDDLLEHLGAVRDSYLETFIATLREQKGRIAIEAPAGRIEGKPSMRVDIVKIDDNDNFHPVEIAAGTAVPWQDGHYDLPSIRLYVLGTVWSSIVVMGWPVPEDLSFLDAWYKRWFEEGFPNAEPFGGYVHLMSEPKRHADKFSILVDLGTAPVEAVRDLVERCAAAGVKNLTIGSSEEALAGPDAA